MKPLRPSYRTVGAPGQVDSVNTEMGKGLFYRWQVCGRCQHKPKTGASDHRAPACRLAILSVLGVDPVQQRMRAVAQVSA